MTFAGFLVFGVVSVLPAVMWGAMRYIGLASLGFVNLLTLYGYATLVFIPAAVRHLSRPCAPCRSSPVLVTREGLGGASVVSGSSLPAVWDPLSLVVSVLRAACVRADVVGDRGLACDRHRGGCVHTVDHEERPAANRGGDA